MTLVSAPARPAGPVTGIVSVASLGTEDALRDLGVVDGEGLSVQEVARRRAQWGPNAVSSHRARLLPVLWHQLRSPLLGLLLAAAVASYFVGERSDAVIIGVIVGLSVGLGFVNEYRAEKAAEALHSQIHHETVVIRDGEPTHGRRHRAGARRRGRAAPGRHRPGRPPAAGRSPAWSATSRC